MSKEIPNHTSKTVEMFCEYRNIFIGNILHPLTCSVQLSEIISMSLRPLTFYPLIRSLSKVLLLLAPGSRLTFEGKFLEKNFSLGWTLCTGETSWMQPQEPQPLAQEMAQHRSHLRTMTCCLYIWISHRLCKTRYGVLMSELYRFWHIRNDGGDNILLVTVALY